MNIIDWKRQASNKLKQVSSTPHIDISAMLKHHLSMSDTDLLLAHDQQLTTNELLELNSKLRRLIKGEPVAYVNRHKEFYNRTFTVDNRVLIPRPESEALIELAIEYFSKHKPPTIPINIIDIGTGSGILGITATFEITAMKPKTLAKRNEMISCYSSRFSKLTIPKERPIKLLLLDNSTAALEVAKENCNRYSVEAIYINHDIYKNNFDTISSRLYHENTLILANLPYVPDEKVEFLTAKSPGLMFEPYEALYSINSGLASYQQLFGSNYRLNKFVASRRSGQVVVCVEALEWQHPEIIDMAESIGLKLLSTKDLGLLFTS